MTKEEYVKLKGLERNRIMSGAVKNHRLDIISKLKGWEEEILKSKEYSLIPQWGWLKDADILEMGINPDTGDIVADRIIEETDPRTKQTRYTHISEQHKKWTERKDARESMSRGFIGSSANCPVEKMEKEAIGAYM